MPLIELTLQDTPARPVLVNTDQVATLKPLRAVVPSPNSNTPGYTETRERGTEIVLANGYKHNVVENYADVLALFKAKPPQANVDALQERLAAKADLAAGIVGSDQLPPMGVPVSDKKLATNIEEPERKVIDAVAEPIEQPQSTAELQAELIAEGQKLTAEREAAEGAPTGGDQITDFQTELDKGAETAKQSAAAIEEMEKKPPVKKAAAKKVTHTTKITKDEGDA